MRARRCGIDQPSAGRALGTPTAVRVLDQLDVDGRQPQLALPAWPSGRVPPSSPGHLTETPPHYSRAVLRAEPPPQALP